MKAFWSSLWTRCRTHPFMSFIVIAIIGFIAWLILVGGVNGSGFNGGNQITTSTIISGFSKGTVTKTEVYQQGKTLWDWLQLLIVPAVLAIGGSLISMRTSRLEQETTKQRDKTEREIAEDDQRESVFQSYIDQMSELLLEKDLRNSQPKDEKRKIVRVRTLTALRRLDAERKKVLIQFLHESNLIDAGDSIVSLEGADLRATNLSFINLIFIDLSEVNLRGSNLRFSILAGSRLHRTDLRQTDLRQTELSKTDISFAYLSSANLCGANLCGANLNGANLSEADLSEAIAAVANLYLANLGKANLNKAFLSHANLSGANLSEANLSEANLSGANLGGANLGGAYLGGANLSGANLSGANLSGANLSGAFVEKEQLDKAKDITGVTISANSQ